MEHTPADLLAGKDAQLEHGIQEMLKRMQAEPRRLPSKPKDPIKTK